MHYLALGHKSYCQDMAQKKKSRQLGRATENPTLAIAQIITPAIKTLTFLYQDAQKNKNNYTIASAGFHSL